MEKSPLLILVVEDEPALRTLVSGVLRDEGYKVNEAGNGQEALDLLATDQANLVLLDMSMPVMDGWEFAKKARQVFPKVPILVMTAGYSTEAQAKQVGAIGFLPKPFDLNTLLEAVASLTKSA